MSDQTTGLENLRKAAAACSPSEPVWFQPSVEGELYSSRYVRADIALQASECTADIMRDLKAQLETQAEEIAGLREALEPFARHLNEMKFDLDHEGNELPDDKAVGWVYVTNGDFRRARTALSHGEKTDG